MARILHVEDRVDWRNIVLNQLRAAGHTVSSFADLRNAKAVYPNGNFDLVICDGSVNEPGDGLAWAVELYVAGQKTVVLASGYEGDVPFISKASYDVKKLVRLLK